MGPLATALLLLLLRTSLSSPLEDPPSEPEESVREARHLPPAILSHFVDKIADHLHDQVGNTNRDRKVNEVVVKEVVNNHHHHHAVKEVVNNHHHHHEVVKEVVREEVPSRRCTTELQEVEEVLYGEEEVEECVSRNVTECHSEPVRRCEDVVKEQCREEEEEQCVEEPEERCLTRWRLEERREEGEECGECGWRGECCQRVVRKVLARVPFLSCNLYSRRRCRSVPVTRCR